MKHIKTFLTAGLLVFVSATTGCKRAETERLVIQGSTTVFPISVATAEAFMKRNPQADISVRGGGSGGGIRALVEGGDIIAQSSRKMRDAERENMLAAGREAVQHIISYDGLALIVHPENPVNNLTIENIRDIYAGKITRWSEVGGKEEYIVVVSRDVGSGTYKTFVDKVMDEIKIHPRSLFQATSGAIVSAVSAAPNAIGYVGFGFISEKVIGISINNVAPTMEAVIAGDFPLVRSLYFYTDGEPEGLTKDFIDFVLSNEGQEIVEREGFIPVK